MQTPSSLRPDRRAQFWQTVVRLKSRGSFWSEDIYGTCDRGSSEGGGEDLCHFSFHICGLLFGKWGGAGAQTQCGGRQRPRVSIRGNKEELLKQIMSESSARNAGRHQNALVLSLPKIHWHYFCPRPKTSAYARESMIPIALPSSFVCAGSCRGS